MYCESQKECLGTQQLGNGFNSSFVLPSGRSYFRFRDCNCSRHKVLATQRELSEPFTHGRGIVDLDLMSLTGKQRDVVIIVVGRKNA